MRKVLSLTMLTVGTIIGAGFASGREIISFFSTRPSPLAALLTAILFFFFCLLFLKVGSKLKAEEIGAVNRAIGGRLDVFLSIALLFNCAVSLSAMLSGFNSLFDAIFKLSPLYSVAAALLSALIVSRGIKGLFKANNILVPLLILVMTAVCAVAIYFGDTYDGDLLNFSILNSFTYVGMNMLLAASVLTTVGDTTKKQRVACSLLTALLLGLLMLLFIIAYNKNHAGDADMPLIEFALTLHPVLYGLSIATISFGIFTTMLTAHLSLTAYLQPLLGGRGYAAALVAVGGLVFSFIGFKAVVRYLYPAVGVIGVLYMVLCVHYLIKGAAPAFTEKLFQRRDRKVHKARKHAKHHH